MNFILDTNTYSDSARGDESAAEHMRTASMVYIPVVVIGELKRGFYHGDRPSLNLVALEKFISKPRVQILDINYKTAEHYGRLSAYLKKQGTPIPVNDVWIAALCVQHDLPLLTRDSDFKQLPQVNLV